VIEFIDFREEEGSVGIAFEGFEQGFLAIIPFTSYWQEMSDKR
jgi:hypothetical protein